MSSNKVIILGCGSSSGVPYLGPNGMPNWGVCDPKLPENYRTRPSIYVIYEGLRLLIDVSPDFRQQYLSNQLPGIDAVILTHAHADHIAGIDDLRQIYFVQGKQPIPLYATEETLDKVKGTFGYLFSSKNALEIYPKVLEPHVITGDFLLQGHPVQVLPQPHGPITSLGLRFGNFAYSTDFSHLEEDTLARLTGLDLWIVDCITFDQPRPTHSHLFQTLDYIEKVQPRRAILTHMGKLIDFKKIQKHLPPHVKPAYDGLVCEF